MKTCCRIKLLRRKVSPQQTQCRICQANHYQIQCELGLITATVPTNGDPVTFSKAVE